MGKKGISILLIASGIILVVLLAGPFLIPVPPPENTIPVKQLADPDSLYQDINEVDIHYKTAGIGEPYIILLHGFGASTFSWREVIEPLAKQGTVVVYDRPAFGLTERPLEWAPGKNPYSPQSQVEILIGLMDSLDIQKAILVGNSAGGTVSLNTALVHPDRVAALVLVDASVYQGGSAPPFIQPLLQTPQFDHLGPLIARKISIRGDDFINSAWANPALITEDIYTGYRKPLLAENWDRALWELTRCSQESSLPDQLSDIQVPSLVISGEDDQIVPLEFSLRLAENLPQARLVVISNCGHLPHEECPYQFLEVVEPFLSALSDDLEK